MMITDTSPSQLSELSQIQTRIFDFMNYSYTYNPNQQFEENHYKLIKQIKKWHSEIGDSPSLIAG